MSHKKLEKLSSRDLGKIEKYIKAFIFKVPQAVVLSRCGERRKYISNSNLSDNDIFEIAIEDNVEIHRKVKEAFALIDPLKEFCLCVEVLLKTAEGDTLILEAWNLRLQYSETFWDPKYRVYAESEIVISNLMTLLKSVITISRVIPSFKLSLGQSAVTYVILYRIYPGEPQIHQLGTSPQSHKVGEVFTPVGTISVSVVYRSKSEMTIAPHNAGKENSFMVKSDYFNLDMSPKRPHSNQRATKNNVLQNSTNCANIGAFATGSHLSDPLFPELAFLQKTILHPSRSTLHHKSSAAEIIADADNANGDMNLNLKEAERNNAKKDADEDCERLSDVSDGSDFVLVNMKPPFADCDPESDLGAFYQECQSAPPLTCFSNQPTLQEQVQDVTNQLEKFEISMMDFDKFVDSVCHADALI